MEANREINRKLRERRIEDQERQTTAKTKAGGTAKAPTAAELEQASVYLKDTGLDPKSVDFAQAQQSLVSVAKQIQQGNKNIPMAQALQQAARLIGSQDITKTKVPGGMFSGDTTKSTYKMVGAIPTDAIPYTGDKSTLIPGRYYKTGNHGVVQFTGTGFVPAQ